MLVAPAQFAPVPVAPTWPGGNLNRLMGPGAYIEPIKRLSIFSPEEFEIFVLQWVEGHVSQKYSEVQWRGGAGDKGRDVLGWLNPSSSPVRQCDIYQCKHYGTLVTPEDIWKELAKVCYFSFIGDYPIPNNYYIVTCKGVGNSLQDLIDKPSNLKKELIDKWDKKCVGKVGKNIPGKLVGPLKDWVDNFDFSVVKTLSPSRLITEHSNTRFHPYVFGITVKSRPAPITPPANIDDKKEVRYIKCILEAYGEHAKVKPFKIDSFTAYPMLKKHFENSRISFYSVETLKEFVRDNFPDNSHFDSLLTDFERGTFHSFCRPCSTGFERMINVCDSAVQLAVDSSILKPQLTPDDRAGMCHHLVNEGRIQSWV